MSNSIQKVSLTEASKDLDRLVDEAHEQNKTFAITKNGKPVAVLMSYDELDSIRETAEIMADPEMMRQIRESKKAFDRDEGKVYTIDELFGEE